MLNAIDTLKMACLLAVGTLLSQTAKAGDSSSPVKTIVLVHGAFADGSSWDRVVPLLQAKGYTVVAVHEPFTSFADDVAATRRAIDKQPGEVILVGHSYGGAVITEAGNSPKVAGLVYVAAFGPDSGESINDLGKGKPPPVWITSLEVDEGGFGWLPPSTVSTRFAQDLPAAETKILTSKQGPIAMKNFDGKIETAAWRSKRSWYVLATRDRMIDPEAQQIMASRMHAATTSVVASHVPMLSKPKEVAAVILSAASSSKSH